MGLIAGSHWLTSVLGASARVGLHAYAKTLHITTTYHPEINFDAQYLFTFWREHQLLLLAQQKHRGVAVLTPSSFLGNIQTKLLRQQGYQVIQRSCSSNLYKEIDETKQTLEEGTSLALVANVPSSKERMVNPGIILLAKKYSLPIVSVTAISDQYWQRKQPLCSHKVPKPFSHSIIHFSKPFIPKGESSHIDVALLTEALNNAESQTLRCLIPKTSASSAVKGKMSKRIDREK